MGILWIVCPVTGRKVSTGIETDRDSFDQIPATPMKCPDCGEQHAWKAMQPKLVEEAQTPSGRR